MIIILEKIKNNINNNIKISIKIFLNFIKIRKDKNSKNKIKIKK
jgi:hypothetical protein